MDNQITFWDKIRRWWRHNTSDRIYWWKCRLWRKYNHVRIRTLSPTWHDRDLVLIHAMFQILSDFMEKEKPAEVTDWNDGEEKIHAWKEIQELNNWWHNVYLKFDVWNEAPIRDEFRPKISYTPIGKGFSTMDQKWDSEEDRKEHEADWNRNTALAKDMERQLEENCIRLIKIRGYLWT